MNYFSQKDLDKIVTAQEVEQSIRFVSKVLEMMRTHSEKHNIELIYKGFIISLNEFENRINTLNLDFDEAVKTNSIEDCNHISKKVQSKHQLKDYKQLCIYI